MTTDKTGLVGNKDAEQQLQKFCHFLPLCFSLYNREVWKYSLIKEFHNFRASLQFGWAKRKPFRNDNTGLSVTARLRKAMFANTSNVIISSILSLVQTERKVSFETEWKQFLEYSLDILYPYSFITTCTYKRGVLSDLGVEHQQIRSVYCF